MKKMICYVVLLFAFMVSNAYSGSTPEFHIAAIKMASSGVAVKVEESWEGNASSPNDGQYKFFIEYSHPNSNQMISVIVTAIATQKPISFVVGSAQINVDGKNYILIQ